MPLQKHEEELLAFREMVEHANDGMLLVEDEKIIECNPAACRLYGLSHDELVGQHPGTLSPEYQENGRRSFEYSRELMADAMAGKARHFLWQHLRSDGTVFTAEISLNPAKTVRLSDNKVVKRYVSVFRDVTRSLEAERALEESEQRFRRLFELAPVALALLSLDGRIVAHNRWHQNLFGYTLEEIPDLDHWWPLAYPDPEDLERIKNLWKAGVERITQSGGELRPTELCVATKSGDRRNLIFGGAMIGSEIVVSFYDVTEERRIRAELEKLNAELEDRVQERTRELADALSTLEQTQEELIRSEKLAGLGALVAGVAHELNTPIGNAVMVASTLREMGTRFNGLLSQRPNKNMADGLLKDLQESAEIMERNLLRAAEMIKGFKQLAVDQSSHQRRTFMLSEIADELRLTLSPRFKGSTVSLTLNVDPEIRMNSYPGPLSQVLINLVNNALVHAFEDSPQGEVHFAARFSGKNQVQLEVSDNGCGIEPRVLPQVFDPFFTTKLGKGGSGLGLHIVHSLVSGILGGSINVTSEPGRGTRVEITLPVNAPDEV